MANHPLRFFWIAFYNDNTLLPQFDPETGEENLFKEVEHEKLIKFGFFPFPPQMVERIRRAGTEVISVPLPTYQIYLEDGDKLIFFRRTFIRTEFSHVSGEARELERETIYGLGYARPYIRRGKVFLKRKNIMYIHENGQVDFTASDTFGTPRWSRKN